MIEDYRKARKLGLKQVAAAKSKKTNPYPPALEEAEPGYAALAEVSLGTMEIPLDLVVGTLTSSRQRTFSCGFLPIAEEGSEFAAKWSRLFDSQVSEGMRDPTVAYEHLGEFYVKEGNKRVSVARYLGMPSIEAQVTRLMPRGGDGGDLYREFLEFYEVAPIYDIRFSAPGSYHKFAGLLGLTLEEPWDEGVIRSVLGEFRLFCTAYVQVEKRTGLAPGDAFLVYLRYYPGLKSRAGTQATMLSRVRDLWKGKPITKAAAHVVAETGGGVASVVRSVVPSKREGT